MRTMQILSGLLCLMLAWAHAATAQAQWRTIGTSRSDAAPAGATIIQAQAAAPLPQVPSTPQAPVQPALPPGTDAFTQAPGAGTEAPGGGFSPQMIGDSLGYVTGFAPSGFFLSINGRSTEVRNQNPLALGASAFKIADNESPRPDDRAFLNLEYFTGVLHSLGLPTDPALRVAHQVFGVEKTFLDGDASIELRVPFIQYHGEDDTGGSDIGDITLINKYVFLSNSDGSVVSGGVALTFPTGPEYSATLINATTFATLQTIKVDPFVFQPFVGYLFNMGDFYVQGFSSLAIPFSDTLSTVWFNDVGLGWYAYRSPGSSISEVVPTLELHLTTPFGHEGANGFPVGEIDELVSTFGVHVEFHNHVLLTLALEIPLTGPKPYDAGYVAQFNYHF